MIPQEAGGFETVSRRTLIYSVKLKNSTILDYTIPWNSSYHSDVHVVHVVHIVHTIAFPSPLPSHHHNHLHLPLSIYNICSPHVVHISSIVTSPASSHLQHLNILTSSTINPDTPHKHSYFNHNDSSAYTDSSDSIQSISTPFALSVHAVHAAHAAHAVHATHPYQ